MKITKEQEEAFARSASFLQHRKPLKIKIPLTFIPSPINLPEKKSGGFSIRHTTVIDRTPIIGVRQALLRGVRPVTGVLSQPLRVHQLHSEKNGIWMTDLPEELFQMAEAIATVKPRGHVLVGGLGLGILPKMLVTQTGAAHVTVVELNKHVIKLTARHDLYSVVGEGILKYINTTPETFQTVMLDTWQPTNEMTYWGTVLPLRRAVRHRWGSKCKLWCWAEDIMWGQVESSLVVGGKLKGWYYENLPAMEPKEAHWFTQNVGLPAWERLYGAAVNKAIKKHGRN